MLEHEDPNRLDMPGAEELPVIYVCQARACYRNAIPSWFVRRWWLISEDLTDPDYIIIRCPEHITDWALSKTRYGRTVAVRQWATQARKLKLPPVRLSDPFPVRYLKALRFDSKDDVPRLEEFMDEIRKRPLYKTHKMDPEAARRMSKKIGHKRDIIGQFAPKK